VPPDSPFTEFTWKRIISSGRFLWKRHTLQRIAEREIGQSDVLEVLESGKCIEYYGEDRPFPSGLFYKDISGRPLHVVAAVDMKGDLGFIITAYEPDTEHFMPDFQTRRAK